MSTAMTQKNTEYIAVQNPDEICITRHMLIEASAGTGKTYTIENLVVRFLEERDDLTIDNLLVVTFTEKATSELKQRIREKIQQRLEELSAGPAADRLQGALEAFDTAPVFTIHGFCQNVLSDYAFENRTLFQNELVDDRPLFESRLREQMRAGWRQRHGEELADMLDLLDLPRSAATFMENVLQVAGSLYRPESGDVLLPDVDKTSFADLRKSIENSVLRLREAVGDGFSDDFVRLNFHAGARKSVLAKIVKPLEKWLAQVQSHRLELPAMVELMDRIGGVRSQGRSGIDCLVPDKWTRKGENLRDCPQLPAVVAALRELAAVLPAAVHFLTVETVRQLQADVAALMESRGWISYSDMLTRVYRALGADRQGRLLRNLRRRYRVAFVDEFQDTDPVQWRIFRKIFLSPDEDADGILCLIGDPKQAIYGFRGADVYAYLEARREMHRLAALGRAGLYSLATNWRSEAGLVDCFNRLFAAPDWFRAGDAVKSDDIVYREALAAPAGARSMELSRDTCPRPCLTVVDLQHNATLREAREQMAALVAEEIDRLLNSADIRMVARSGTERPLDAGDIGILVRSSSDVPPLETALSSGGIPYTYYKKPGLFTCEEAQSLGLVLRAVYDPADTSAVKKALLTPFFDLKTDMVNAWEELPPDHVIRRLIVAWNELAVQRNWSRLFQSLMEDSGLICRWSKDAGWERMQTNYQQIVESLQIEAYRRSLDFRGLCALFDAWRRQGGGEDADIHQIETEARKVQVMTIHVSKGLEFPVVFLAGGFTRYTGRARRTVYHRENEGGRAVTRVIDLTGESGVEQQSAEDREEEKRLFYVALTRARFKLYVPYMPFEGEQAWVGSVSRLLAPALQATVSGGDVSEKVLWLDPQRKSGGWEKPLGKGMEAGKGNSGLADRGVPRPAFPVLADHRSRKPRMNSFSSLHAATEDNGTGGFQGAGEEVRQDDESIAGGAAVSVGDDRMLPGGTRTGNLLHAILENIDFQAVARLAGGRIEGAAHLLEDGRTAELIRENMQACGMPARFDREVCRLVAGALLAPLPGIDGGLRMADLAPQVRRHEVEFLYPVSVPMESDTAVHGCRLQYGKGAFIRGFVDLVFRWREKYYIADWKSNFIENGYHREALESKMEQSDYHLQYMIYTVAVCRWLKVATGERFQPRSDFGGVLYLFLRGMPEREGLYFVPGEQLADIDRLENRIRRRLATVPGGWKR
jgi:exodeoxyribonuclease V beta subunit